MAQEIISLNLRAVEAQKEAAEAIFQGTRDTFRDKILPLAKKLSPREAELRPGRLIHNADSLAVRSRRTKKGPKITMFSQSGHGGFLEKGTKVQPAHPYMYPAFQANSQALFGAVKTKINSVAPKVRKK